MFCLISALSLSGPNPDEQPQIKRMGSPDKIKFGKKDFILSLRSGR